MRKGGGKQKGAQFEREVCVKLSTWMTAGKKDDCYWRSAMSGGRATVASRRGKSLSNQAGDITCIDPDGKSLTDKFVIECKRYADLNYVGLLSDRGKLVEFWNTLLEETKKYKKLPFLFAQQNRQPATICLTLQGTLKFPGCDAYKARLIAPTKNLYIFDAEFFLANVPPCK